MMTREIGDKRFPIWLLGDSNPANWQKVLDTPLDPRHPVRHSIWTSVLDVIQDRVFREIANRVDTSPIYIRNAVGNPASKPASKDTDWKQSVRAEIGDFQELIGRYDPRIVLCFGAFSFEFARRATDHLPNRKYGYWSTRRLGDAFRSQIAHFDFGAVNIIPMLHRSIAAGMFLESHEYFAGKKEQTISIMWGLRLLI